MGVKYIYIFHICICIEALHLIMWTRVQPWVGKQ